MCQNSKLDRNCTARRGSTPQVWSASLMDGLLQKYSNYDYILQIKLWNYTRQYRTFMNKNDSEVT